MFQVKVLPCPLVFIPVCELSHHTSRYMNILQRKNKKNYVMRVHCNPFIMETVVFLYILEEAKKDHVSVHSVNTLQQVCSSSSSFFLP